MTYGFGSGTPDPLVLNGGTFTTVDINGGTIDGTVIGGAVAAAGTFTDITASGNIAGIAGNASGPGVRITADPNTGIFWPAADTLGFSTGGSERARFDSSGNLLVGTTSGTDKLIVNGTGAQRVASLNAAGTAMLYTGLSNLTLVGGESSTDAMLYARKDNTTSRSINAAGTVNASGTDYAEYELKADGCGDFAKGDIVGFDVNGKLTDVFADAVSFAIKSTNPSYVGGDTWHGGLERPEQPVYVGPDYTGVGPSPVDEDGNPTDPEQQAQYEADQAAYAEAVSAAEAAHAQAVTQWESDLSTFEAALEEKRQRVDRVAYAGKVPVNGIDGATPGYFVLAADNGSGGIKAITKASPTLSEYTKLCVGKVRNNGADGRAIVEVKMG